MSAYVRRPSAGFLLLVASYALLIYFFKWAHDKPDLERGWDVLQRMQRDSFTGFTAGEVQLLDNLLTHDSRFARALVGKSPIGFVEPTDDGWIGLSESHLVMQASSTPLRMRVESRANSDRYPLTVLMESKGWQKSLALSAGGSEVVELPPLLSAAWIRVTLKSVSATNSKDAPAAIRIRLEDSDSARAQ